ncbi:Hsp20/alpha crystallin family protein [Deinococcus sp. KNUC1210]|uniref:Hsp20/alpha crystallin family protein n=1 Tax=Deinococcus sp. KNUC1210 TaxID=2917691 RepID=UPI001EF07F5E|nr:Hsp20/alpha crystallin family protein [Deinococcus sp. KNUC1210]ULH16338.1 Hsp20/alpha crystallin family protein [Deinococcus sp. KNUC1210]
MMRFDPFRDIEELTQRLDRAFYTNPQTARFAPPVDVHEDDQGLEIVLDLPGVQPSNVQIEAESQTLTVQAERRYERKEGRTAHRVERASGSFFRTFSVPAKYDLSRVDASFENGTLTIAIPRSEAAQRRTISLRTDSKTLDAGRENAAHQG